MPAKHRFVCCIGRYAAEQHAITDRDNTFMRLGSGCTNALQPLLYASTRAAWQQPAGGRTRVAADVEQVLQRAARQEAHALLHMPFKY